MQVLNLSFPEQRFFCPLTGEQIIHEEGLNEEAATLAALWLADTFDEPTVKDAKLGGAWQEIVAGLQGDDGEPDGAALERFLRDYPSDHHVAFKLADSGSACAADFTVWLVLDFSRS